MTVVTSNERRRDETKNVNPKNDIRKRLVHVKRQKKFPSGQAILQYHLSNAPLIGLDTESNGPDLESSIFVNSQRIKPVFVGLAIFSLTF